MSTGGGMTPEIPDEYRRARGPDIEGFELALCKQPGSPEQLAALVEELKQSSGFVVARDPRALLGISKTIGGIVIWPATEIWTALLRPCHLVYHEVCSEVSRRLDVPVISFTDLDEGSCWRYQLFVAGELVDQHCSVPELLEDDCKPPSLRGNAEVLCRFLGGLPDVVEPYLIQFTADEHDRIRMDVELTVKTKAHPSDTYSLASPFAFVDMLEKLGIRIGDWLKIWFSMTPFASGPSLYPTLYVSRFWPAS